MGKEPYFSALKKNRIDVSGLEPLKDKHFLGAGKTFVLTDYNPKALRYAVDRLKKRYYGVKNT